MAPSPSPLRPGVPVGITTNTRRGLSSGHHRWGPLLGHQWGLSHGHGQLSGHLRHTRLPRPERHSATAIRRAIRLLTPRLQSQEEHSFSKALHIGAADRFLCRSARRVILKRAVSAQCDRSAARCIKIAELLVRRFGPGPWRILRHVHTLEEFTWAGSNSVGRLRMSARVEPQESLDRSLQELPRTRNVPKGPALSGLISNVQKRWSKSRNIRSRPR